MAVSERARQAPTRLPRGRHQLTREEVVRSQRRRICEAVLALAAAHGLADITVATIVRAARVSRETFYACFENKDACYELALVDGLQGLCATLAGYPTAEGDGPRDRLRIALVRYLEALRDEPDLASCLTSAPVDGPMPQPMDVAIRPAVEDLLTAAPAFDVRAAVLAIRACVAEARPSSPPTALADELVAYVSAHRLAV